MAYFIAAAVCFSAIRCVSPPHLKGVKTFWLLLSVALVALGVNKELDLHVMLVETIRRSPVAVQGENEPQLLALGVFLIGGAVVGSLVCRGSFSALRSAPSEVLRAFGASAALALVLLLRFAPIESISAFLSIHILGEGEGLWHAHLVELFEFPLVVSITVYAWRFRRLAPTRATT